MPLQATSGAASYDGFGGGVPIIPQYIEEVFSTYLYTGNGATNQTITNNIDLSTKGGLVWIKNRPTTPSHFLSDSGSNFASYMSSNAATANTSCSSFFAATTSGFTLTGAGGGLTNNTGDGYASWTFRKQPKFFDVVTYTGTGANRTIAHNLGSAPGCMIVKTTSNAVAWNVYHRSLTSAAYQLELNNTSAEFSDPTIWNSTAPTSTEFSVGTNAGINGSGRTYVAYLFAHNAGGFGLTGTDNVISCGSFTTNGSAAATVNIGYEPQFVLFKRTDSSTNGDWVMFDNMRGLPATGSGSIAARLIANTSAVENPNTGDIKITSTGFVIDYVPSASFIYIAIRRGPMKVPTTGTSVYNGIARTSAGGTEVITGAGFTPDLVTARYRAGTGVGGVLFEDRLRGTLKELASATSGAETSVAGSVSAFGMDGATIGSTTYWNNFNWDFIYYFFKRAPSFFDEVCYTGTGSAQTLTHNLGAVPELMIVKRRTAGTGDFWFVYSASTGNTIYLSLNTTSAVEIFSGIWNDTTPTSTQFTIGYYISQSAAPYVAYLFATCAGVSKVGSYTGTGATQTINCGFTGGARWVMVKRTNSTGDWYVWDTARGMVSGTDPSLLLNSTAAEVNANSVYTATTGFQIVSTAAGINASGGNYIFLAIA